MIRCFCLRKKRCAFGAMSLTAVICLRRDIAFAVICLRRDICPSGKLWINTLALAIAKISLRLKAEI